MGRRKMLEIGKAIFKQLLESETPLSLSEVQEQMGTHFDTLKQHLKYIQLAQSMPRVKTTEVGRQIMVETEKRSGDIEFIKEMIGEELPHHIYLLIELYDSGATNFERAIPLSLFPLDQSFLDEQAEKGRVIITTSQRAYLTPLGVGIARGAKRYISLTGIARKAFPSISFDIKPEAMEPFSAKGLGDTIKIPREVPGIKVKIVEKRIVIEIPLKTIEAIEESE